MGFPPFFVCLLGPGRSMVQKRNIDIDGWLGPFGGTADIHYTGWLRTGFPDSWLKKKKYTKGSIIPHNHQPTGVDRSHCSIASLLLKVTVLRRDQVLFRGRDGNQLWQDACAAQGTVRARRPRMGLQLYH